MMSGIPPIEPQVTMDLELGSTSIYWTVDATLSSSLSFFGNGFLWQGGGLLIDWQCKKLSIVVVNTIYNCYIIV